MSKWWPFKRGSEPDPEALFRQAEAALRAELAARAADGLSRQALLKEVEAAASALENGAATPDEKARLRALDLLYEELRPALLRNLTTGKMHEMAGRIDEAIPCYETAVADQVATRFPYEHLRVIYNRRNQHDDALRICRAALDNPFLSGADHDHFRRWADHFAAQLSDRV